MHRRSGLQVLVLVVAVAVGHACADRIQAQTLTPTVQVPSVTPTWTRTATPSRPTATWEPVATQTPLPTLTPRVSRTPTRTRTTTPTRSPTRPPTLPPAFFPSILRQPTDRPTATPKPEFNCRDVVTNGDFEQGTNGWIEAPTTGEPIIRTDRPHRGTIGAWFAGFDNAHDLMMSRSSFFMPRKDGGLSGDLVRGRISGAVAMVSSENGKETDTLSLTIQGWDWQYDCEYDTDRHPRGDWFEGGCDFPNELMAAASQSFADVVITGKTSPRHPSGWAVDDVKVELCTRW